MPQVFEAAAEAVLNECQAIATQRGGDYADSWRLDNLQAPLTRSTLDSFGVRLEPEQIRLLLMSALVDVKISRITAGGPFKRDSYVDGINYLAALCQLRQEYGDTKRQTPDENSLAGICAR